MNKKIDIGSDQDFPAGILSNFSPHEFEFDGVKCASMEGLLQSLKSDRPEQQLEICQLTGKEAKKRGRKRNQAWQSRQRLWWQGEEFDRHGSWYQELLDRAFAALSGNEEFRLALLVTESAILTHSIGQSDPMKTVLTEEEFCSRLTKLREELKEKLKH